MKDKDFTIRKYTPGDEYAIADVVSSALIESNRKDYPPEFIRQDLEDHSAEIMAKRASDTRHMYVVWMVRTLSDTGRLMAIGAAKPRAI